MLLEGATEPSLSADGRRLAYQRGAQTRPALNVADADGSHATEVVPAGVFVVIRSPRIAPDGRSILFAAPAEAVTSLPTSPARLPWLARLLGISRAEAHGLPSYVWSVDVASGQRRRLTDVALDDLMVAWGEGGRSVVILAFDGLYRTLPEEGALQRTDGGAIGFLDAR